MIEFKEVTKSFGPVLALDRLSITIPKGRIVGLFGPNGAGKSTALKLAMGLNRPDQGLVTVDGCEPTAYKEHMAFLPEVDHLYSWMTLKQAAGFMRSFYSDWDEQKYHELLGFLNISEDMKLSKISKGQRAKCKLLLVVARQAPYLLLDEPLSGIDIFTRDQIIQTLIRDFREGEQTIIISTHEIHEVESLVDDVIFLDKGQVRLAGEAEELRNEHGMSVVDIIKEVFRHAE